MIKKVCIVGFIIIIMACIYFCANNTTSHQDRKVYAVLALTGPLADVGHVEKGAIEGYLKANNSSLNVIYIDSAFNPIKALSGLQHAIIGDSRPIVLTSCTSIAAAIAPFVESSGGSTICTGTTELDEVDKNEHAQRISTLGKFSAGAMADYIGKHFQSVTVIYSDNDYGVTIRDSIKETLSKYRNVSCICIPLSIKDANVRELTIKAINGHTDCIYVTSAATPAFINVFKELKALGYTGKILADTTFTVPSVARSLGTLKNDIVFTCFDSDLSMPNTARGIKFKRLCSDFNIPANFLAVEIYDSMALIDFMVKNGREMSKAGFLQVGKFPSVTGEIVFEERGNAEYKCVVGTITGDVVKSVE